VGIIIPWSQANRQRLLAAVLVLPRGVLAILALLPMDFTSRPEPLHRRRHRHAAGTSAAALLVQSARIEVGLVRLIMRFVKIRISTHQLSLQQVDRPSAISEVCLRVQ
jgi:hypothetical protein